MKSFLTILSFFFLINVASSQASVWWFDAGIKAGYGPTGLYNKNITDSNDFNNDIAYGYSFGGKFSINYDNHGMTIDAMLSKGAHSYEYIQGQNLPVINRDLEWNTFDIYALYRNNRNITYFEIGPKISFLRSAEQQIENESFVDVTEFYSDNELSAVLGFGWYAMGTDGSFSGILGLRFEYGITDFVGDKGQELGYPIPSLDETYVKSNRLYASIMFEMNWGIGYFGKANCGARSKFIRF